MGSGKREESTALGNWGKLGVLNDLSRDGRVGSMEKHTVTAVRPLRNWGGDDGCRKGEDGESELWRGAVSVLLSVQLKYCMVTYS